MTKRRLIFVSVSVILVAIVIALLVVFLLPAPPQYEAPWYDSDWGYRQKLTIYGSPAGAQTDYQIRLTVYKESGITNGSEIYLNNNCSDNFADIRFTASDGVTKLDHWLENESLVSSYKAVFWVEVDHIPEWPDSTAFYIYYGNPDVNSASDGPATFIVFEPFDNLSRWSVVAGGNWTASDGVCHQTYTGTGSSLTWEGGLSLDSPPGIDSRRVSCNIKLVDISQERFAAFSAKWSDTTHFLHCELRKTSSPVQRCHADNGYWKAEYNANCNIRYQTWYRLTVGVNGNGSVRAWVDGVEKQSFTDADWDKTWTGINLHTYASRADFDDLFVANYCDPEPSWVPIDKEHSAPAKTPSAATNEENLTGIGIAIGLGVGISVSIILVVGFAVWFFAKRLKAKG